MPSFKDRGGNTRSISLRVSHLPLLREVGLNLSDYYENPIGLLDLDPEILCRALYALCEDAIDPDAFAGLLDGDTLAAAADALMESLVLFRRRPAIAAPLLTALRAATVQAETQIGATIDSALSQPATSSPASSESTPVP